MRHVLAGVLSALLLAGCTAVPAEPPRTDVTYRAGVLAPPPDPIAQYASDRLSFMTLEEKVRSMLMVRAAGTDASAWQSMIRAQGVAGIILMGDNVPAPAERLATLTSQVHAESGLPALISIDQEGGVVRRVPSDTYPAAWQLRHEPPDATRAAFQSRSQLLESLGVSINFGIVADVSADSRDFIYSRSYGGTPQAAAERVAAAVEGERHRVLSTLKHFPGHGAAAGDSHVSVPTTAMSEADWREGHAAPFAAGVDAGAELVMLAHVRFSAIDALPASQSAVWVSKLRSEFGFDGVIVTDDMTMLEHSGESEFADQVTNAVRAVAAGVTLLLYVGAVDIAAVTAGVVDAVESGSIHGDTVDDAARRLLEVRRALSGETGRFVHCDAECRTLIG